MASRTLEVSGVGFLTATFGDGFEQHLGPRLHDDSDFEASYQLDAVATEIAADRDPELAACAEVVVTACGYAREYNRHGMPDPVREAIELGHLAHTSELLAA